MFVKYFKLGKKINLTLWSINKKKNFSSKINKTENKFILDTFTNNNSFHPSNNINRIQNIFFL